MSVKIAQYFMTHYLSNAILSCHGGDGFHTFAPLASIMEKSFIIQAQSRRRSDDQRVTAGL